MTSEHPRVLLVGASVRALAQSARRAGWQPIASDLFGDLDLTRIAAYVAIDDYPQGFVQVAAATDFDGCIYTGGLENHPRVLAALARSGPLWGCSASAVRRVRAPEFCASALRSAGLRVPDVVPATAPPAADESWLQKPRRSAGGRGIRVWTRQRGAERHVSDWFFQKRVRGLPLAAVFLASSRSVDLIGLTLQMVGSRSLNADEFVYCGSIGPVRVSDDSRQQIERAGGRIARSAGLHGLFGMDLVLNDEGVWTIEVNPRVTASVEIFERAWHVSLLPVHRQACESFGSPGTSKDGEPWPGLPTRPQGQWSNDANGRIVAGKAILFADRTIAVSDLEALFEANGDSAESLIADIPRIGSRIRAGHPVCTVLATGRSCAQCAVRLSRGADLITREQWLHRTHDTFVER